MGSFRSQPDLQKHTDHSLGVGLQYVSSHMCGNYLSLTQVGEFTCKMHIFLCHLLLTRKTLCSPSSMATEVKLFSNLGA